MSSISLPAVNFNIVAGAIDVANAPQKVLLIGQGVSGSVAAGSLTSRIGNASEEDTFFGRRTMIATMVREFRRINTVSQIDVVNIEDPTTGAVAATSTITFVGTSTKSGNIEISIQSDKLHKFIVPVAIGSSESTVAASFQNFLVADDTLLFTSSVSAGVISLTAVHTGEEMNNSTIRLITHIDGITTTIDAISGGVGVVTIPALNDLVGDTRYQKIVYPAYYNHDIIKTFLDNRFSADNIILDGVAVLTKTSDANTLVADALTLNSNSIILNCNKVTSENNFKGGALAELNVIQSAQFCAIRALELTDGTNIARYRVGNNILNTAGGDYMAAVPLHNTPIPQLPIIGNNYGWSRPEQTFLNSNGCTLFGNNVSLTSIIIGDVVTTYQKNAAGLSDITFKYLNYVETASVIREYFFNNNKQEFSQKSLTNGDLIAGLPMANADSIATYQLSLYETLAGSKYGLVQAGSQAETFFKKNLIATINESTGIATISMIIPIVTQLRGINGTMQIGFEINKG
tara:strand:- start:1811 stop:3361 length:1551 start_codon:yes stop_codon:yes gene_type:complete